MEPKFQSSFIPKGPLASTAGIASGQKGKERGLLAYIALVVFIVSVVLAAGIYGYKFYLKYSIEKMGTALEEIRATLQPDTINELTSLDNRIVSTKELISQHVALTPLFEFLEISTPKTVRFKELNYNFTQDGIDLNMRGEARGYAALALLADIFNKSTYFKNPVFSDLTLNDKGDVVFSFKGAVDPNLVLYKRQVEPAPAPVAPAVTPKPESTTPPPPPPPPPPQ